MQLRKLTKVEWTTIFLFACLFLAVVWPRRCDISPKHTKMTPAMAGEPAPQLIYEPDDTSTELIPDGIEWNTIICYLVEENKKLKERVEKLEEK